MEGKLYRVVSPHKNSFHRVTDGKAWSCLPLCICGSLA